MFDALKALAPTRKWDETNKNLELTVEALKSMYPHMFLQPHELKHRKFFDEPATVVPMASFVHPLKDAKNRFVPRKK